MPSRPKDKGGREKRESLNWMVGEKYLELQTIKEWGLTPKGWRLQPVSDRVDMMAYCRVKSKMEASDNEIMEKKYQTGRKTGENNNKKGSKSWR